ncbi:conserved hypothetical protein [Gammaproteobacteria bacterium]
MNTVIATDVYDSPEYGTVLKCYDLIVADEFEDFLTESCFVFFQTKFDQNEVTFFFGQASSVQKVRDLFKRFNQC